MPIISSPKTVEVKAIFKGRSGSCGYNRDQEYKLHLGHEEKDKINIYTIKGHEKDGYCEYSSMLTFLENWDNIRNV